MRPSRPLLAAAAALLAVVALAGITAALAVGAHDRARRGAIESQRDLAQRAGEAVHATMGGAVGRLADTAILSAPSTFNDPEDRRLQFRALRHVMLAQPGVFGFGIAQVFGHRERAAVERRLGRPLLDATASGKPVPARRHERYVVPVHVAYQGGGTAGLGVNLAAEPGRRATLELAARRHLPQLSPPVRLIGSGSPQALLVYAPVFDARWRLTGYTIGSLLTRQLMDDVRRVTGAGAVFGVRLGEWLDRAPGTLRSPREERVAVGGRTLSVVVGRPDHDHTATVAIALGGGTVTVLVALLLVQFALRERTARKLSERHARERDTAVLRFSSAFEHAPIGMAVVTPAGRWEQVNDALCRQLGRPPEALQGRHVHELLGAAEREVADAMATALKQEGATRIDRDLRVQPRPDGPARWFSVSATAVRRPDGETEHFILQVEDVTEQRAYEQRLEHLASHDPLTGLLNRRALAGLLDRHVAAPPGGPGSGALLVLDLDQFKAVNDLLGHGTGDRLLTDVASALRGRLRGSDAVARLGGDEFAVLLPQADRAQALRVAGDLLAVVRETAVPDAPTDRSVTASIGIALVDDEPGLTGELLLVRADLALYDAKEAGRDAAVVYAADGDERLRTEARLAWVQRVRDALDHGGFELHYQPIVELASGRVRGLEALVRLRAADGDLVGPASFLPLVERYGLAARLDLWVLDRVLQDMRAHRATEAFWSVNVSGRSLGAPGFLDEVERRLLRHADLAPRLVLELTETAAIADMAQAQAVARRVRDLGARLALDDFGVGFGSFFYLKHLPFDLLKIDGEFVRACTEDQLDREIVLAAVAIARAAGTTTVAEHVGTPEAEALVRDLGVDLAQGHRLGRPAPLHTLERLLAAA